jgi:hypothetical protein
MEPLGYKPQKGPHDGAKACLKQAIGKKQLKPHGEIYRMLKMEFHTFKGQQTNLMLHMNVLERTLNKFSKESKEGILTKPHVLIT